MTGGRGQGKQIIFDYSSDPYTQDISIQNHDSLVHLKHPRPYFRPLPLGSTSSPL